MEFPSSHLRCSGRLGVFLFNCDLGELRLVNMLLLYTAAGRTADSFDEKIFLGGEITKFFICVWWWPFISLSSIVLFVGESSWLLVEGLS